MIDTREWREAANAFFVSVEDRRAIETLCAEIDCLRAVNAELLRACKLRIEDHQCNQLSDGPHDGCPCWYCTACRAIAKAEKGSGS